MLFPSCSLSIPAIDMAALLCEQGVAVLVGGLSGFACANEFTVEASTTKS